MKTVELEHKVKCFGYRIEDDANSIAFMTDTLPTEKLMKDESKIWKPFRTVASLYLWKITDDEFEW